MKANGSNVLSRSIRFLARPELVVHETPTPADEEAERIIRDIASMYGSPDDITVIKWGKRAQVQWVLPSKLPALRTVGGIFHGLEAIKDIATVEKRDWERANRYSLDH
jgi:hypothetical protein